MQLPSVRHLSPDAGGIEPMRALQWLGGGAVDRHPAIPQA